MRVSDLVWLDLCSGLGGASQPAKDRGWRVIRVDIDPRFKPDIVADVRRLLPLRPFHIDVLWASPPCQEFSKHGLRCFYPNPPDPNLEIAEAIRRAILIHQPTFWVVENVWASRRWLTKIFGPVRALPKGHALWSNLAFLLPTLPAHKGSLHYPQASGRRWGNMGHSQRKLWAERSTQGLSFVGTGHNGLSAAAAAIIPYEIGEAICRAVETRLGVTP